MSPCLLHSDCHIYTKGQMFPSTSCSESAQFYPTCFKNNSADAAGSVIYGGVLDNKRHVNTGLWDHCSNYLLFAWCSVS